ncbi:SufD family Fe-S cluster assembly protein [Lacticaseibacillus kribbianus]|uniref:SufD family Fe-S cluster assembly protein n=1 Tax=Lacticaseibacillus kribbianus TaxID=2926292 RepID=UPI001CD7057E|nr:SufD family Fe-S cluster assembly protein [Lacticaseibacillus kribbianus]
MRELPSTPKIALGRMLRRAPAAAVLPVTVSADAAVTVTPGLGIEAQDGLEDWLLAAAGTAVTVTVPERYAGTTPVEVVGPADGSALVRVVVGPHAKVTIRDTWKTTGEGLGLGVWLEVAEGATVSWLTYDSLAATAVVAQHKATLGAGASLNWTVAGFSKASGASLITTDLIGDGAQATVNVGVLASGVQHLGYTTRMTNYARKSVGHINQRGVITGAAHLIFNGIGHIVQGAQGADNQQENRVLMLASQARGDANPILLIDENDVTAGHAASVTRVYQAQLYYLMSRGLSRALASRLVIRGFLEAGLAEITDRRLKQELFDTIDETLVTTDA